MSAKDVAAYLVGLGKLLAHLRDVTATMEVQQRLRQLDPFRAHLPLQDLQHIFRALFACVVCGDHEAALHQVLHAPLVDGNIRVGVA